MNNLTKFRNWLAEQDYWIQRDVVDRKAEELGIHFPNMTGITCKMDDDGNTLVPRRDYRRFAKVKNEL